MTKLRSTVASLRSPRWAYWVCYGLVCLAFLSFGATLNRYPLAYCDEATFNYPAVRFLDGKGFNYWWRSDAPYADSIWAYHAPFYPRMQVLTFRLLGVNQFACRIPQYLAAHFAIFALCTLLLQRGLYRSALVVATAWLGDRSHYEVLYGRMEGLSLLMLVFALICLWQGIHWKSFFWSAASGTCLGLAVGFHPVALYFGCAMLVAVIVATDSGRDRIISGIITGGCFPLALVLWCWMPNISASWEQFHWRLTTQFANDAHVNLGHWIQTLLWSKYWVIALVTVTAVWLAPLAAKRLYRRARQGPLEPNETLWVLAALFSVAWVILLVSNNRSLFPYYLVYFTVWPVLALAVMWESSRDNPRHLRLQQAIGLFLLLAWLPSLAWNAMRFRELAMNYERIDSRPFGDLLVKLIPAEAEVTGTPELFIVARDAKLKFDPPPSQQYNVDVSRTAWVIVTEQDRTDERITPGSLIGRPIVFEGSVFPRATHPGLRCPVIVYGPKTNGASGPASL